MADLPAPLAQSTSRRRGFGIAVIPGDERLFKSRAAAERAREKRPDAAEMVISEWIDGAGRRRGFCVIHQSFFDGPSDEDYAAEHARPANAPPLPEDLRLLAAAARGSWADCSGGALVHAGEGWVDALEALADNLEDRCKPIDFSGLIIAHARLLAALCLPAEARQ